MGTSGQRDHISEDPPSTLCSLSGWQSREPKASFNVKVKAWPYALDNQFGPMAIERIWLLDPVVVGWQLAVAEAARPRHLTLETVRAIVVCFDTS
jgi:hypothetical protein